MLQESTVAMPNVSARDVGSCPRRASARRLRSSGALLAAPRDRVAGAVDGPGGWQVQDRHIFHSAESTSFHHRRTITCHDSASSRSRVLVRIILMGLTGSGVGSPPPRHSLLRCLGTRFETRVRDGSGAQTPRNRGFWRAQLASRTTRGRRRSQNPSVYANRQAVVAPRLVGSTPAPLRWAESGMVEPKIRDPSMGADGRLGSATVRPPLFGSSCRCAPAAQDRGGASRRAQCPYPKWFPETGRPFRQSTSMNPWRVFASGGR